MIGRTLAGIGCVMLLWVAGWGIDRSMAAADGPKGAPPGDVAKEVKASSGEVDKEADVAKPNVVIESAGAYESTLYFVEIRNAGSTLVDLTGWDLVAGGDLHLADRGLEVVRGSLKLGPRERALIITHPGVPTSDVVRDSYDHLYRAIRADGALASLRNGGGAIVDRSGGQIVEFDPDGPDPIGRCCRPAAGEVCRQQWPQGPDQCDGTMQQMCISHVKFSECCNTYDGCCFEEIDEYCPQNSCKGFSPTHYCY